MTHLLQWLELTSRWELLAVVLAVAYVILAVKKNIACWFAAVASSGIYVVLMVESRLYMEAALNAFYVAMAIYGYWEWRRGRTAGGDLAVQRWNYRAHGSAIALMLLLAAVNGWLLLRYTNAARPYVDSLITWSSVIATWMVARRVAENWLYWIVIDAVAAVLYFQQHREPTGFLFLFYVGISIHGLLSWMRSSRASCNLEVET